MLSGTAPGSLAQSRCLPSPPVVCALCETRWLHELLRCWEAVCRTSKDLPELDSLKDADHLVIDCEHLGSVSRLLRCCSDPNLECRRVLLPGAGSALLHRVAFFANADIPALTELRRSTSRAQSWDP